jgi:hypothetical protein
MATIDSTNSAASAGTLRRLWSRADGLLRRPAFAYLTIALLQLTAVWGMWERRDTTRGDTVMYFDRAYAWFDHRGDTILWSPLYTAFYGSMLYVSRDPSTATLLHRLVIVFTATILVLAVLRRVLPAAVAWLVAAWWAVLPIQFDTLYEVHLFAVIPVLVSWWLVAVRDSSWNRGAALAVLVASAVLVRNEMGLAAILFAGVCAWREWPRLRADAAPGRAARVANAATAYALPLAVAAATVLYFYQHSDSKFASADTPYNLRALLREKHEVNMSQVYAFGYLQRHPEWGHNHWVDHRQLMTETFGKESLPLSEMIRANPRAVLEHFAWNFRLLPHGLQVLLFNATSGRSNPDYVDVNKGSDAALVASYALLAVWGVGLALLLRDRRAELRYYLRGRETVWLAMLCVAAVALPVIATQRPRPSYLFALGIVLMAGTGVCLTAIAGRFAALRRCAGLVAPVALACYLFSPLHPTFAAVNPHTPLTDAIHRLRPYEPLMARPETRFLGGQYAFELLTYLGRHPQVHSFGYELLAKRDAGESLDAFLERQGINLFYVDDDLLGKLEVDKTGYAKVLLTPGQSHWKLIGSGDVPRDRWRLYRLGQPES